MSSDVPVPELVADLQEQALGHPAPMRWEDAIEILAGHAGVSSDEAEKMLNAPPAGANANWAARARVIPGDPPAEP